MTTTDRRSLRLAFVFLGLIFLCLSLVGYLGAMRSVTALSPVWVTVTATPGAALQDLELTALSPYDKPVSVTANAPGRWWIARAPVRDLRLRLGAGWRERLDAVEVRIGARRYRYGAEDLATQW